MTRETNWPAGRDAFVRESAERYLLTAPLRFATVAQLRRAGLALIEAAERSLVLDLSRVPTVDSAGLALLIEWLARARAVRKTLHYAQPPDALRALARLSEVESLLTADQNG